MLVEAPKNSINKLSDGYFYKVKSVPCHHAESRSGMMKFMEFPYGLYIVHQPMAKIVLKVTNEVKHQEL